MGSKLQLDGVRFGALTATNTTFREHGRTLRLCVCDCSKETLVLTHSLISGHTKSCGCAKSLELGRAAQNSLMLDYQHAARRRNLEWQLLFEDFIVMTTGYCYFCSCPPSCVKSKPSYNGDFIYNGIDRLDNNVGYTKENCVTCCWTCNNAKSKMSVREFTDWLERFGGRIHETV